MITDAELFNWFADHRPVGTGPARQQEIREAGFAFAKVIVSNTFPSADQTAAVRKVREATATALAAIACGGK